MRLQTQQFIRQYQKQFSADFDHLNTPPNPTEKDHSFQSIIVKSPQMKVPQVQVAPDPNRVVHKDSGPLPLPVSELIV